MKTFRNLTIAGCLCAAPGVHAAALSDMNIAIDWNSLAILGPYGGPASFTDPLGNTYSSDAEGWVGNQFGELGNQYAANGAGAVATYNSSILDLMGGYDAVENGNGGRAAVTNDGLGEQSGYAGGYRGMFFQAIGTGQVTVSLNYSLVGTVSTTTVYDYATAGYQVYMDAADADLWVSTYQTAIANGASHDAADAAANAAATLFVFDEADWNLIEVGGCWNAESCSSSFDDFGVLSMTFDVVEGGHYFFGFDGTASAYTNSYASPVPVPAAVWLFGSGLVGLVGVARRKAA